MSSKKLISFESLQEGHPFFWDGDEPPDWDKVFPNSQPLKLEIGFGNGAFLIEMALREPQFNLIGMDFYHKGIRKVITRVDKLMIQNICVVYGDAREKIPYLFRPESLQEVFINFPDPWPKKRHGKRRLLKPEFIDLLADKMVDRGELHVATDSPAYAEEILVHLEESTRLKNKLGKNQVAHSRDRFPKTKYEKNFINAGETIHYFDFIKC